MLLRPRSAISLSTSDLNSERLAISTFTASRSVSATPRIATVVISREIRYPERLNSSASSSVRVAGSVVKEKMAFMRVTMRA